MGLLILAEGCNCPEQFEPGVIIAADSSMEKLKDGNGLFFTLRGSERISDTELRDVVILHGLVLPPPVAVRGSGVAHDRNCLTSIETFTWHLGDWKAGPFNLPDGKLKVRYDGKRKEVTVGSSHFDTRKGNLLIIKLDSEWQASAVQLPARGEGAKSLADFRQEFPDVKELQEAHLYKEGRR